MNDNLLPFLIILVFILVLVFTTAEGKEPRRAVMTGLPQLDQSIIAPRCPRRAVVLPQLDGTEWIFLVPNLSNCQET